MEKETIRSILLAAAVITLFCTGILSQSSAGLEHEAAEWLKTYTGVPVKSMIGMEQLSKITKSFNLIFSEKKNKDFLVPLNTELPELKVRIENTKFSRLYIPEKKFEVKYFLNKQKTN